MLNSTVARLLSQAATNRAANEWSLSVSAMPLRMQIPHFWRQPNYTFARAARGVQHRVERAVAIQSLLQVEGVGVVLIKTVKCLACPACVAEPPPPSILKRRRHIVAPDAACARPHPSAARLCKALRMRRECCRWCLLRQPPPRAGVRRPPRPKSLTREGGKLHHSLPLPPFALDVHLEAQRGA